MKGQHRKNANQLDFIFNKDVMKKRRRVLDVEKLSIQCKDLLWYQYYWLSVE